MKWMDSTNAGIEPVGIVIFGASGDLTKRKLVPALHSLACDDLIHPDTRVIGVARSALSDLDFHDRLYDGVTEYARLEPRVCELWSDFEKKVFYLAGSYEDPDTYRRLGDRLAQLDAEAGTRGNRLLYLAIPPNLYPVVIEQLGKAGLNLNDSGWTRIIIEKPFGHDLKSAQQLNEQTHAVFGEDQVYRIDHYLGKETVQNLMTFRFANAIFEPLWNRNYVDHVQISMLESVGVGHRAGYYDKAGVLRDVFQNHVLQLLTLTAMEAPSAFNAKTLRDEKVKVLQSIRPISRSDGIWGQYQGYREEERVAPGSQTPTYIALKLYVDNWRWQGVPFYVRSGKHLTRKATEITLQFKRVPHLIFPEKAGLTPNSLTLCIQPDEGMHLQFETKIPGAGMRAEPVEMDFHYSERFGEQALPEAYERLLLDAIQGDASLFARSDEIELAWRLVDPLTADSAPVFYSPGSWGPAEAEALLAQDGREWLKGCACAHTSRQEID
jgi:glucose-6-phosphate 1-dehydrogenase